jgi:hypothetical protein
MTAHGAAETRRTSSSAQTPGWPNDSIRSPPARSMILTFVCLPVGGRGHRNEGGQLRRSYASKRNNRRPLLVAYAPFFDRTPPLSPPFDLLLEVLEDDGRPLVAVLAGLPRVDHEPHRRRLDAELAHLDAIRRWGQTRLFVVVRAGVMNEEGSATERRTRATSRETDTGE